MSSLYLFFVLEDKRELRFYHRPRSQMKQPVVTEKSLYIPGGM